MRKTALLVLLLLVAAAAGQLCAQNAVPTLPLRHVAGWEGDRAIVTGSSLTTAATPTLIVDGRTGKMTETSGYRLPAAPTTSAAPADARNPVLSPDGKYLAYTRRNDLYTLRLADRRETRLTADGSEVVLNGRASWVYMEEILGRKTDYCAFWWSPDSRHIAFFRADEAQVPLFTITDSPGRHGYVETLRYPKAGDPLPQVRLGVVSPEGGTIVWAATDTSEEHYLAQPFWRPDSKAVWLQWSNRAQKHLKVLEMHLATGQLKPIYEERQPTWISIEDTSRIHFLASGKGFILASDKSGWRRLYLHDMNGRLLHPLTDDRSTVLQVLGIDEKKQCVFYTCHKDHPGCEDLYRARLDGKRQQRLTFGNYTHRVSLSGNGNYFITAYSNLQTPPRMDMYRTDGRFVCRIQDTKTDAFEHTERPRTEFITLPTDDGQCFIPLRIIWPLKMEPGKQYPVKINIYGGPNTISAREGWVDVFHPDVYRPAGQGVIAVTLDHRGSGHNGKVGQEYLHRRLGYWELKDYTQAVRWLVANRQADPERILITGFSYGGYLTCYALTCGAGVFTHGIAGGSVTDWQLYDATYTERFMDHPADNPNGYRRSSVLTHADSLHGRLLLTHGLRDENVHIQHTWQLADTLQERQKPFELMVYPESRHGYRGRKQQFSRAHEAAFIERYLLGTGTENWE